MGFARHTPSAMVGLLLVILLLGGCGKSIEMEIVGEVPGLVFYDLVVQGDSLYAATETLLGDPVDDLIILDISVPEQPKIIGRLENATPDRWWTSDIAIKDNYAYIGRYPIGLVTVDISDPSQPMEVDSYEPFDSINDIKIQGDYAYVAGGWRGLLIFDISVPDAPVLVGELATPDSATMLQVAGDFAFISIWHTGMFIADISDPSAPKYVSTNDELREPYIHIRGDRAFVTDGYMKHGLASVDISDPRDTKIVDFEPLALSRGFALAEDTAYVNMGGSLGVIRVAESGSLQKLGEAEILTGGELPGQELALGSVATSGDHVFVSIGSWGGSSSGTGARLLVMTQVE